MATSEEMRPKKGILKRSSSLDQRTDSSHSQSQSHKEMSWDEMNILATHHPPDKDYGHMKIDEPPTPYSKNSDVEEEDVIEAEGERRGSVGKSCSLDPSSLTSRLSDHTEAAVLCHPRLADDGEEDDDDEEEETEEDQAERHKFELKRKLHYNEFQAVQLAKKLMAEEEDEDDDEEDDSNVNMEEQSKNTPVESQNKEK